MGTQKPGMIRPEHTSQGCSPEGDRAVKVCGRYGSSRMLHAKVLFSPVAHANTCSIHTSEAEKLPGVHAVVCYKDAPEVLFNSCGEEIDGAKTERIFDDHVRYVGDKVAAVAADTVKIAEQALKLIKVEYEELPFYCLRRRHWERGLIRSTASPM